MLCTQTVGQLFDGLEGRGGGGERRREGRREWRGGRGLREESRGEERK